MNNLYEIIGNLLAAFAVGLLAYLVPKARAWIQANTDAATQENIRRLVQSFARAAEQLYHDQDPTGEKRRQFVQEQLRSLGVEVTEMVINMIEGAVWEINTENRKALVQTKELVSLSENSKVVIDKDKIEFSQVTAPYTTCGTDHIQCGTVGMGQATIGIAPETRGEANGNG